MDAGDLAVFAAVAEAGGINRAARHLNTVQSNVTQRIRLLERELGLPLFHRHSRGVTLTGAGAELLPYAQKIGHLIAEAKRAATDGPVPAGRLCIGALETTAALRLPPILTAYAGTYGEVDIELRTGTTAELLDGVLDRRIEGAFVAGPLDHPELAAETIVTERLVLVTEPKIASLDHFTAAARGHEIKIIVFRAGCSYRETLERFLAGHGLGPIRRLELGTLDGIIGCVGAGIGVTLLPRAVATAAATRGQIALHEIATPEMQVDTLFVRRRDAFVSSALARFVDCAKARGGAATAPVAVPLAAARAAKRAARGG